MAQQEEELRLTISLVDNASAGVARIRSEFQQLSSGSTAAHVESFKRHQGEVAKQITEMGHLAEGGGRAILGFISRFGPAGAAIGAVAGTTYVAAKNLAEYASKITDLGNRAKVIGISPGVLKGIEEQFEAIGLSAEDADRNVQSFNNAYAEMGRTGSERHLALLRRAGTHGDEMEASIQRVLSQTTQETRMNEVLAQRQVVFNNRLKETNGNVADATQFADEFVAAWGLDPVFKLIGHIKTVSKADQELWEQRAENARKFQEHLAGLRKAWNDWMADIKNSLIAPGGVIDRQIEVYKWELRGIRDIIEREQVGIDNLGKLWEKYVSPWLKEPPGGAPVPEGALTGAAPPPPEAAALPPTSPEALKAFEQAPGGVLRGPGAPGGALPLLEAETASKDYSDTVKANTIELKRLND